MHFLRALTIGTRRGRIASVDELAVGLREGAAYLAQGASYSYIRARTGMVTARLLENPDFAEAMQRCKWEGFAAAAGDLALIAEGDMRPHGAPSAGFWRRLYRDLLAAEPVPPHRAGWDDRIAEFEARLERHLARPAGTPPPGIEDVAAFSAGVIMEYAPVDESIRAFDREMVMNNVKFRFIDQVTDLRRRCDWPALAAAARAAAPEDGAPEDRTPEDGAVAPEGGAGR